MTMSEHRSYRQLRAWQVGMELAEETYRTSRRFPREERFGLTSQMKRAATSIPMNLAEGYGRGGREFVRFVGIAYGSLLELETQVQLARRLEFLGEAEAEVLLTQTAELGRILNGLRRSLLAALEPKAEPRIRESETAYLRRRTEPCALTTDA
jgi:four helix bundle protein